LQEKASRHPGLKLTLKRQKKTDKGKPSYTLNAHKEIATTTTTAAAAAAEQGILMRWA
jgi:hypothetical protein